MTQEKLKQNEQEETVEQHEFEPIKGYPMLNWRGKRPFTSTQYYPAQLKEVHGEEIDGWRNKIYWGDNLQVMSHLLKEFRSKIGLIYIDPPFDSKADYKRTIRLKGKSVSSDTNSFEEKQYTDIWTNDEYLQFMYERCVLLRELLSDAGTFAMHCDIKKSHYLKVILDEIFGQNNFRTEVIVRTGVKNVQSQFEEISTLSLGHNSILIYSKQTSKKYPKLQFNSEEHEPGKWDTFWRSTDRHTMRYELLGITPSYGQWRWQKSRADTAIKNYEEYLSQGNDKPLDEHYLENLENDRDLDFVRLSNDGVVQYYVPPRKYKMLSNIWLDIPYRGTETDYPTEKNEAILERLVNWTTNPSELVMDCFMGGGTTQAVALKTGRKFIGADINSGSIFSTTKRLLNVTREPKQAGLLISDENKKYTGFEVYNVNHYDIFRNPVQAKELLLEALEVNTIQTGAVFDGEKDGRMIKIMPVNRIATKADLGEIITGIDWKSYEKRQSENPNKPVEKITLVCMGHEPELAGQLELELKPLKIDVEVFDILRDKANLEFKRDSQARVVVKNGHLNIEAFYPMNLLQKLSLQKENVEDWRELVESVLIDWNYDGAVLNPTTVDIPEKKDDLVSGTYHVPKDAGTIRVKITDLLSESWEGNVHD